MIFAQAAQSAPWWQSALVPIGAILAAFVAGAFALRNARKTPHENLKSLIELRESIADYSDTLDPESEIDAAIKHEINNLGELRKAADQGLWAYQGEKIAQSEAWTALLTITNSMASGFLVTRMLERDVTLLDGLTSIGLMFFLFFFVLRSAKHMKIYRDGGIPSTRIRFSSAGVRWLFPMWFFLSLVYSTSIIVKLLMTSGPVSFT